MDPRGSTPKTRETFVEFSRSCNEAGSRRRVPPTNNLSGERKGGSEMWGEEIEGLGREQKCGARGLKGDYS